MLLLTVIVILLIWAAVVSSIYSSFLVFYGNFSQTENYHKAYYAAIAALERAELAVKQRWAWFQWSGWWNANVNITSWPLSDHKPTWFSYLSDTDKPSTLQRSITSRTKRIPQIWQWDVDRTIFSWTSIDYNKMDYENAEIFLLYYDKWISSDAYKNNISYQKSPIQTISGTIRLPNKLKDSFWILDTSKPLFGVVNDDAIVDWQLRGKYNSNDFTIYATQKLQQTPWNRFKPTAGDSSIRESNLSESQWATLTFWNNKNPKKTSPDSNSTFTIISPNEQQIASLNSFQNVFNNSNTSNLSLRLALLNLLKSKNNLIYPYLEYYLDFWEVEVSDKYFHINAEWKFWDYQVNLLVDKPTVKESILWSFTVVF